MKFDRQLRSARDFVGGLVWWWNNFKTADGRHFKNRYIAISQRKIIRFRWNSVHSSRFSTGWTSRNQKWKSCIGQTPISTERISCLVYFWNSSGWVHQQCPWSKLLHQMSMTRFEKKYFLISILNLGLQIFLLWPRKPLSIPSSANKTLMSISV